MIGCGNATAAEITNRFPQPFGNLAHRARFPHFHKPLPVVGTEKNEELPNAVNLSTKSDQVQRFEELAQELRTFVIRFREPARAESDECVPNVYKSPPLTEQDLAGDPIIRYHGTDGACIGMAVAEVGGTRYGLARRQLLSPVGDNYFCR
jgi:hypothetical protein